MNPVKNGNPNFFPPIQAERNPHNSNTHNHFLAKNQTWIQTQARFFCHKYSALPIGPDEVAQQIRIGLWQALLSYNPAKGVPFLTFACQTTIRQNLTQLLRNQRKHRRCLSLDATLQTNNPSQPRTLADTLKANPPTPPKIHPEILNFLPNDNQAQTAQLLYHGCTYEEIRKLLGLKSKAKVSDLVQKIRQNKAFRKALSEWIVDKNNENDPRI